MIYERNTQKKTSSRSPRVVGWFNRFPKNNWFISGLRRQVTYDIRKRTNEKLSRSNLELYPDSARKPNVKRVGTVFIERDQIPPSWQSSTSPPYSSCPPTPPASPVLTGSTLDHPPSSPLCSSPLPAEVDYDADDENVEVFETLKIEYDEGSQSSPIYVVSSPSSVTTKENEKEVIFEEARGQESLVSISGQSLAQSEASLTLSHQVIHQTSSPLQDFSDLSQISCTEIPSLTQYNSRDSAFESLVESEDEELDHDTMKLSESDTDTIPLTPSPLAYAASFSTSPPVMLN